MARRLRVLLALSMLACGGLAAAPVALAGDPCFHGYTIPAPTTEATSAVTMEPCAFVPTNIRVAQGTTVTFTNASGDVHLLTGANQTWGDLEKEVLPGRSVSVTFEEAGVYAFSCALHRGMSGAVIVEEPSEGAATASTATSGSSGLLGGAAFLGLALVAAIGWAVALIQRRRVGAAAPPGQRLPVA